MSETVIIKNAALTATIGNKGAELLSLVPVWGGELMWQADPAVWGWHAPNLFPIVSALADDTLIHQGKRYPLKSHGFLRHSQTTVTEKTGDSVLFQLSDTEETRRQFPFAFVLTIAYRLDGDRLLQTFTVTNPAVEPLLVSLGAHPAFRWPLSDDLPRASHRVVFAQAEPQPIRRVAAKGLGPDYHATPVTGRVLTLDDSLFDNDAVIWDHLNSDSLTFGVAGQLGVEIAYSDFPHFGIWTKPGGARFLCLEPWQGHISPVGFSGEFADKPGVVAIASGAGRSWSLAIRPIRHLPSE